MSPETLKLFAQLLGQVQISPSQPDFDESYQRITKARKELGEALREANNNGEVVEDLNIDAELVG